MHKKSFTLNVEQYLTECVKVHRVLPNFVSEGVTVLIQIMCDRQIEEFSAYMYVVCENPFSLDIWTMDQHWRAADYLCCS